MQETSNHRLSVYRKSVFRFRHSSMTEVSNKCDMEGRHLSMMENTHDITTPVVTFDGKTNKDLSLWDPIRSEEPCGVVMAIILEHETRSEGPQMQQCPVLWRD